jgi:aryl carrier-like protein
MLSEHLAGFVSVIGLPLAEVDYQENGEHLMKQMLAAQVTIAPWENVLAYVTPGETQCSVHV